MLSYKSGYSIVNADAKERFNRTARVNGFNFAENTTYGLGGNAETAYFPKNIPEAVAVYDRLTDTDTPFVCLGNGSDVLAADGGFAGCVVSTAKLKGIIRINRNEILALAGTTVAEILKYCKRNLLTGTEFLYGIPATVGGLTYMNGGAGGEYIGSVVRSVIIYDGGIRTLSNASCGFSYKHSAMQNGKCLVLGSYLTVSPCDRATINQRTEKFRLARKKLPKGKSCGCVFKNPENISAGKLIEDTGLKGAAIGGAFVSEEHANFIINKNGTAKQVRLLIEIVKLSVYKKFGVTLEEEVEYIGDFDDTYR